MTESEIQQGDKVSWSWGNGQPDGKVAEVKDQGEIAIESNRGNTIKKNASPDNPAVHVERSGNDVVKRASELQVHKKADGANGQSNGESKKVEDKPAETEKEDKPTESEKKDEEIKDGPSTEEKKEDAQPNGDAQTEGSEEEPKEDPKTDEKASEKSSENAKPAGTDDKKIGANKAGSKRKAEESPAEKTNGAEADRESPDAKKAKTDNANGAGETKKKGGRPKAGEKKEKEPAKKRAPKKAATADGQPRRSGRNRS